MDVGTKCRPRSVAHWAKGEAPKMIFFSVIPEAEARHDRSRMYSLWLKIYRLKRLATLSLVAAILGMAYFSLTGTSHNRNLTEMRIGRESRKLRFHVETVLEETGFLLPNVGHLQKCFVYPYKNLPETFFSGFILVMKPEEIDIGIRWSVGFIDSKSHRKHVRIDDSPMKKTAVTQRRLRWIALGCNRILDSLRRLRASWIEYDRRDLQHNMTDLMQLKKQGDIFLTPHFDLPHTNRQAKEYRDWLSRLFGGIRLDDSWGHAIRFRFDNKSLTISSDGLDGIAGTTDDLYENVEFGT